MIEGNYITRDTELFENVSETEYVTTVTIKKYIQNA